MMSDVSDTHCHVWEVDSQSPDDESFAFPTFIIDIQARLTAAPHEEEEDEDGEPCSWELESVIYEMTEEVRADRLMDENDNVGAVRDMLVSVNVPVEDFMVVKILDCAHRMAAMEVYRNRKVLRMRVEIEAVVDELPDNYNHDDEEEEEDDETETAEKLTRVVIQAPNSCCSICLEDFLVGSEAASTPCSHVFHYHCILPWLCRRKPCPVCRSELSS